MSFWNVIGMIKAGRDKSQLTFPPEKYPNLKGKVAVVTGGNSGLGFEVSRLLALQGCKVYILARSAEKATGCLARIEAECREKQQECLVEFLAMDLTDLQSVQRAARTIISREKELHFVVHNAGVMVPNRELYEAQMRREFAGEGEEYVGESPDAQIGGEPVEAVEIAENSPNSFEITGKAAESLEDLPETSISSQNTGKPSESPPNAPKLPPTTHEIHLATNNIGPHLLQRLLDPLVLSTSESGTRVAIVWVSSLLYYLSDHGGISWTDLHHSRARKTTVMPYSQSKAGNIIQAAQWSLRVGNGKVVSVAVRPGRLNTDLDRYAGKSATQSPIRTFISQYFGKWLGGNEPIYGAYAVLYALLSEEVTVEANGGLVVPMSKMGSVRGDIEEASKGAEGQKFWQWLEEQTEEYRRDRRDRNV